MLLIIYLQNYYIQDLIKSTLDGFIREINIYEKKKPDFFYYIIDSLIQKNDYYLLKFFEK